MTVYRVVSKPVARRTGPTPSYDVTYTGATLVLYPGATYTGATPGATYTGATLVLPTPGLLWCYLHLGYPGATYTRATPVLHTPGLPSYYL